MQHRPSLGVLALVVVGSAACDSQRSNAQPLEEAPARTTAAAEESSPVASASAAPTVVLASSASASAAAPSASVASARGGMWGDEIGDAFGAGGLGLSGIGEGGGGRGEGIGLGTIGMIGHGAGTGTGQGFGSGRLGGSRGGKPPSVRMGGVSVTGKLPPEVIQRIVRQNFGRFRLCYENGLRSNPTLEGQVAVGFVIATDGSVGKVSSLPTTDLKDAGVVSCVTKAFYGLSFPQPESGIVNVTYPIKFAPGDPPAKAMIGGKALATVTSSDIEKALRDAGYEDVTSSPKADAKDAFTITAKKAGKTFTVTFVPASAAADTLSAAEVTRLSKDAATLREGSFFIAVESDDKKASQSLLDTIVKR